MNARMIGLCLCLGICALPAYSLDPELLERFGRELPYRLGWFTQTVRGNQLVWHYGWWPPHVSGLYLKVPERNLSFIVLGNTEVLSKGFGLHRGDVRRSPAARLFLETFVF